MSLNYVNVVNSIARGTSYVCAMCERYWEGWAENGDPLIRKCNSTKKCGSPLVGDDYNNYKGEISNFSMWCIYTGEPSIYGMRLVGRTRVLGLSEKGLAFLRKLVMDMFVDPTLVEVVNRKGTPVSLAVGKSEDPKTLTNLLGKIQRGEV